MGTSNFVEHYSAPYVAPHAVPYTAHYARHFAEIQRHGCMCRKSHLPCSGAAVFQMTLRYTGFIDFD